MAAIFYTEKETLSLPSSNNLSEVNIATELTHQLTFLKLKNEDMTISRLKGELVVDQGKRYLLAEKHATSSEIMLYGKVDIDRLSLALEKIGVKGSMEKVNIDDGCGSNVLHVVEPSKALIQVKETCIVIRTGDESLASLISDAVHSLLDGI